MKEEDDEADACLAVFIIDGECPKCGKTVTRGHRNHLISCSGAKKREKPVLPELVKVESRNVKIEEEKLKALDLAGLVELTDLHALFMVVGSTGVLLPAVSYRCFCIYRFMSQIH